MTVAEKITKLRNQIDLLQESYCEKCELSICEQCPYDIEVISVSGEKAVDMVNHPAHYETGKYECIDVMTEVLGIDETSYFCLGNAFKYIYRCLHKHDDPKEDVQKAIWYLNKFLELQR